MGKYNRIIMSNNSAFEQITYAGQVVVVTGAASGIGKSAAKLIAARGASVICVDLNSEGCRGFVGKTEKRKMMRVKQCDQLIGQCGMTCDQSLKRAGWGGMCPWAEV